MASTPGTANLLAGIAYLSIDGTSYYVVGEAKYSVASVKRETVSGMDGVHGFKENPQAGYIALKLRDTGGLSVADFNAMTGVTVVLSLANGKTIMASNAWTVEAQEVDVGEAAFDVRFESAKVEEI